MKMFKKYIFVLMFCLLGIPGANACINVEINVGVPDTVEGRLMADIIGTIILERSGVKADLHYFASSAELDQAVVEKKVDILVENTGNALGILNKPLEDDPEQNFMTVKIIYKRDKGLVWLKPFGYHLDKNNMSSMVVSKEILDKFPGMPRVLGKLSGSIDDKTFTKLIGLVESGQKSKKVAKDFLVSKKFI